MKAQRWGLTLLQSLLQSLEAELPFLPLSKEYSQQILYRWQDRFPEDRSCALPKDPGPEHFECHGRRYIRVAGGKESLEIFRVTRRTKPPQTESEAPDIGRPSPAQPQINTQPRAKSLEYIQYLVQIEDEDMHYQASSCPGLAPTLDEASPLSSSPTSPATSQTMPFEILLFEILDGIWKSGNNS